MGDTASAGEGARLPSILFVDDEPLVLRSLRRAMSARSADWDLRFAESSEAALEALGTAPADVVVSDMHMPGMDGAALLQRVQERYPDTVRIVLSGHTDPKLVFRSVPVAHQFLTKPFEIAQLAATLERALDLRKLIGNPALRAVVGAHSQLPTPPKTYTALTRLLARDDTSLTEVVAVIERDVALSARIAQLAASASFRVPKTVRSLAGFVQFLGADLIKSLVLTVEIVTMFRVPPALAHGFSLDELEKHSLAVAAVARRIVERREDADDVVLAAMLHDVGRLVLAARAPRELALAIQRSQREKIPLCDAEQLELGATHADVGAYLLGIWGLPAPIVEAVAHHHRPEHLVPGLGNLAATVYVANLLSHDPEAEVREGSKLAIPPAFLERFRATDLVPKWRATARDALLAAGA